MYNESACRNELSHSCNLYKCERINLIGAQAPISQSILKTKLYLRKELFPKFITFNFKTGKLMF